MLRSSDGVTVATLGEPASPAFRGGTLLITDFKAIIPDEEGGLYAVDLGMCGAPPATRL